MPREILPIQRNAMQRNAMQCYEMCNAPDQRGYGLFRLDWFWVERRVCSVGCADGWFGLAWDLRPASMQSSVGFGALVSTQTQCLRQPHPGVACQYHDKRRCLDWNRSEANRCAGAMDGGEREVSGLPSTMPRWIRVLVFLLFL
mmetsp:Transcript_3889/g.8462  ORF Transcript_3889/g.8462 Transcript_3889/m.8462 type:complete len:144 (+) Transcript_3889:830-1261(+)